MNLIFAVAIGVSLSKFLGPAMTPDVRYGRFLTRGNTLSYLATFSALVFVGLLKLLLFMYLGYAIVLIAAVTLTSSATNERAWNGLPTFDGEF